VCIVQASELPTILIYETIDLGLVSTLQDNRISLDHLESNSLSFTSDPLYVDTVYVHHNLGAHCLMLSPWLETFAKSLRDANEIEKALVDPEATEVFWILRALPTDSDSR
jgi:nucleoporin NUP82